MMRSLKSLWSLGRTANDNVQTVPQLPAPDVSAPADEKSLRERLLQDFTRAHYGAVCRTLAFPGVVDGTSVYYRAVAADTIFSQWVIQRVTESSVQMETNTLPVQTDNAKFDVVKTGLDFFHAIEYLAHTEMLQDSPSIGPTRDDLKLGHYESFAKLHLIGFDLKGMPQPTMNGQIVTGGSYSKAMMDDLQKSLQDTDTKAVLAQKAWEGALANTGKPDDLYNETLVRAQDLKDVAVAADLSDFLIAVQNDILNSNSFFLSHRGATKSTYAARAYLVDKYLSSRPHSPIKDTASGLMEHYMDFKNNRSLQVLRGCEWVISNIESKKIKVPLTQFVTDFVCFSTVQDAAFYLRAGANNPSNNANKAMQDFSDSYVYAKIGKCPGDDWKDKVAKLQWSMAEKKARSEFMSLVVSTPKIQAVPKGFIETAQKFEALRMQAQYDADRAIAKIRRGPIGGSREWI